MCRNLPEDIVTDLERKRLLEILEEVNDLRRQNWVKYYRHCEPTIDVDYEVVKETATEGGIEKVFPLQATEKGGGPN